MSRPLMPSNFVGNEFVVSQPRLVPAAAAPVIKQIAPSILTPVVAAPVERHEFTPPANVVHQHNYDIRDRFDGFMQIIHRYSLAVFALLLLLIGTSGIQVGKIYWNAHLITSQKAVAATIKPAVRTIAGFNISVPTTELQARLQKITAQPANIVVGDQTIAISPDVIKSWLNIAASKDKTHSHVGIKADAIGASLLSIANQSVKAPLDSVVSTVSGAPVTIVTGHDGVKLTNGADLKTQADAIAKTVMDGKGLQFNAPLSPQAFAVVTPAAFDKLIEVNVVTKQMYLFDHGNLFKSYPISAGAPTTPTPIGEYHVFSKLPLQDMKGFNADGSKYLQPRVRWISYFLPGGYAVHGNYWRPTSWFGNINSSHGCVSLPEDQAEEVYNWTPMGTTVITHN